ncbi:cell division protein FtsQ [Herbihabitans rhizosphaerae]|uniref:Cell division protein FtsQ n=1 Tax=Herbihabitans rhizosphaerae TaxID=1872711 RepID=A0A4Q7KLI5_9PSEU|nr:FtsQ-type POTRA domain-containing protein [Herbihabitans rhizosphaerae]RZS34806.1 cell division protein FtsQ [Herbihabitans rhizosphaerae]
MTTVRGSARDRARARRAADDEPPRRSSKMKVIIGLAVVTTLVCVGMFTSVLGVRSIDVTGTVSLTADEVRAAAAIEDGTPMLRLSTDEVRARVAKLPRVAEVEVERSWPSTVDIRVTERAAVAIVKSAEGTRLVDASGVNFALADEPPAGLPELKVANPTVADPATRAAVQVLAKLPDSLRAAVATVTAQTPGNVQLSLVDGRTVKWGDQNNSDRKVAVLVPLLTLKDKKVFDVATPEMATVS